MKVILRPYWTLARMGDVAIALKRARRQVKGSGTCGEGG